VDGDCGRVHNDPTTKRVVDNVAKMLYNTHLATKEVKMGQYANAVNAYAMSAARAQVYKVQNTLQSYGQTSYMLNVTTNKFRKDIEAKKVKFIAKMELDKIAKMQKEIAHLQAKHSIA
jgi:hypothetical protein